MGDAAPASGYRPVSIYDAPGVILQQLLDNEASLGSIRDTLFREQALSPSERESFAEQFVRAHKIDSSAGRAATQVLLNPWVWLMVGMSALPFGRVKATAEGLFATKAKPWLEKHAGILHTLGLATPAQTHGESAIALHRLLGGQKHELDAALAGSLGPVLQDFLDTLGTKTGKKISSLRDLPSDLSTALGARALGLDTEEGLRRFVARTEPRYAYRRRADGPEAPWTVVQEDVDGIYSDLVSKRKWQELKARDEVRVNRGAEAEFEFAAPEAGTTSGATNPDWKGTGRLVDPALVQDVLDRYGVGEKAQTLLAKVHEESRKAFQRTLGADGGLQSGSSLPGAGGQLPFAVDGRKVQRIASGVSEPMWSGADRGLEGHEGMELLYSLGAGPETLRALRKGYFEGGRPKWEQMMREVYEPALNSKSPYFPMNNTDVAKVAGHTFDADQISIAKDRPFVQGISGRVVPATSDDILFHQDTLDELVKLADDEGRIRLQAMRAQVDQEAIRNLGQGRATIVHKLDFGAQVEKHFHQMHTTEVLHGRGIGAEGVQALEEMQKSLPSKWNLIGWKKNPMTGKTVSMRKAASTWAPDETPGLFGSAAEDVTPAMFLQKVHDVTEDPFQRRIVREVYPDALLDQSRSSNVLTKITQIQTQKMAGAFADSGIGKAIASVGPNAARFIDEMKAYSTREVKSGLSLEGDLAKYLYVTHLGINVSSALVNLMQPLLLVGPTVGYGNLLKGYARAAGEMIEYAGKRAAQGFKPLTDIERDKMIGSTFKFAKQSGIMSSTLSMLDSTLQAERLTQRKGVGQMAFEYAMKMFEKSEQFVRTTAAHSVEAWYDANRLSKANPKFLNDVERMVLESSYGASGVNTPTVFMRNPLLGHPLVRQFLSFPLRTATAIFGVSPTWGNRGYGEGLARNIVMGMGASAVVYEIGRELAGANLARGLFASGSTDILGLQRLGSGEQQGPIPVPPALDIPYDFLRSLGTGDADLMRNSILRLVPGGVAANKMLQVLPDLSNIGLDRLQRSYAGWDTPLPDGSIPIYKGGRLVEFKKPSTLVYQALGVDLGSANDTGELDGYLVKQREEISKYRQQLLMAMRANDYAKVASVRADFERKFKDPTTGQPIPLTVNQQQLRAFMKATDTPRTERILDRISPELRQVYGRMVGAGPQLGTNVPLQSIQGGGTSGSRDEQRAGRTSFSRQQREAAMPGSSKETEGAYRGTYKAPEGY